MNTIDMHEWHKPEKSLWIAVDFDGTCVTHDYPEVGKDIGAVEVLKKLTSAGHALILYTMRSAHTLQDAIKWFKENGIFLQGVQYNPTQAGWTCSNKCYAHIYIDDAALGCPLIFPKDGSRAYVDWKKIDKLLKDRKLYD